MTYFFFCSGECFYTRNVLVFCYFIFYRIIYVPQNRHVCCFIKWVYFCFFKLHCCVEYSFSIDCQWCGIVLRPPAEGTNVICVYFDMFELQSTEFVLNPHTQSMITDKDTFPTPLDCFHVPISSSKCGGLCSQMGTLTSLSCCSSSFSTMSSTTCCKFSSDTPP